MAGGGGRFPLESKKQHDQTDMERNRTIVEYGIVKKGGNQDAKRDWKTGRIQTGSFDDKDGNRRFTTDVVADQVNFLESKGQRQQSSSNQSSNAAPYDYPSAPPVTNNVNVDNDPFADFGDSVSIDDNFLD